MKFFFPDSSDLVDPSFDFNTETRSESRVRQRDDVYAHEVFDAPPYDGLLVSKAIVEGSGGAGGRYTIAQRNRLLREGVRRFFRLDPNTSRAHLATMGDCGAFTYVREKLPPYSVEQVSDFYSQCDFDLGISVDHVILGYDASLDDGIPGLNAAPPDWRDRQEITLTLAADFFTLHQRQKPRFRAIGVAQGWSPASYAHSVNLLQKMGYRYIAIGGIVPLKTFEIVAILDAVKVVQHSETAFHLLGVTRGDQLARFKDYGVASFDSTSPLRQAFKDDTDNYYTPDRTYPAVRIPQVQANPKLQRNILSGRVNYEQARRLERECLEAFRRHDEGDYDLSNLLASLRDYEALYDDGRIDRTAAYREVLTDQPWRQCPCNVCKSLGAQVIMFRGAERNRRRGFHNLFVFFQRLQQELKLLEG